MEINILDTILGDRLSIVKFYKEELNGLIKEFEQLKPRFDEIQAGIAKKQEIIEALENFQGLNNSILTSNGNKETVFNGFKWRQEIYKFFGLFKKRATAFEIAEFVIESYRLSNDSEKKELRNKISITCAGLYRDGKLDRVQAEAGDFIYFEKEYDNIFSENNKYVK